MSRTRRSPLVVATLLLAFAGLWLGRGAGPVATRTDATDDAPAAAPAAAHADAASAIEPAPAAADAVGRTEVAASAPATTPPRTRVCVRDGDHLPIEGATVETFADSAPGVATTDAAGWCEVPGARGDGHRLLVRAGNRHLQAYWIPRLELTIELPWWGPLRGRLLDADSDAPVASATLKLHHPCKECAPDAAVTDRDGSFTFAAVPRDQDIGLEVVADGYPPQYVRRQLPGRGEPVACTFRVQRGVTVAGRCIDLDTRQPIAGATVECPNPATTDAGGHFAALVLPGKEYQLRFSAPGYLRATYHPSAPPSADAEFVLPRGAVLFGHVWSTGDQPIGGARLSAREDSRQPLPPFVGMPSGVRVEQASDQSIVTYAAADGGYRIEGLLPGTNRVFCRHDDYEPASAGGRVGIPVEVRRDGTAIDFHLQPRRPSGTIVGTFTVNGEPCDGSMRWRGPNGEGYAQIDCAGRFRIERVEAGRVELIVVAHRFEDIDDRSRFELRRNIAVEAGQEAQITLAQEIVVAAVRGSVHYDDGQPAGGCSVFALPTRQFAKVGEDGTYELKLPVLPGPYSLSCGSEGGRSVTTPADHVDFVIKRRVLGSLRVRAIDGGTGRDVGRATFLVVPADEQRAYPRDVRAAPDPEGYRRAEVARGNAVLLGWAEGFAPTVQRVLVGAEPTTVDVRLLRGCSVELRLAAGAERPPDRLQVRWIDAALLEADAEACLRYWSEPGIWTRPGRDVPLARGGTIRDVGAGRHHLVSSDPAILIVPEYVDVLPGSAPVFELGWRRQQ